MVEGITKQTHIIKHTEIKMAIFKFYTYRYVPNEAQRQLHLAFDEDNKLIHADGVQQFGSLFNDKTHLDLTIAKDKKCTEWEIYKMPCAAP